MELAANTASETVQVSQHSPYTPQIVFAAWFDQKALDQWFGPHSHRCQVEEYDFWPGGRYRIRMTPISEDTDCEGDSNVDSVCAGEFVKITPNEEIVMSFTWIENGGDIGDTLLTVSFNRAGDGADVVIFHERLPDDASRKAHQGGWQGTLECLETYLLENTG